ncbi:MAG: Beta-xylosidase [Planctomycetes bacterium ADurb.Bin401]|nr:MAG: Beta-xylosidase [Planctomycetes bacterium ADurb.Bin401]
MKRFVFVIALSLFSFSFAEEMVMIKNPILRGFNPDPSIVRVEEDYYIATSTFEWFGGVAIHHSQDLVNWELTDYGLKTTKHIDLLGNPTSGGVWAPCLTYSDGLFYLIYSDVKNHQGPYKDVHNYLITAENIHGPWAEPIYLNSSGFDPSMFHDDDGKKWLLNMLWDHRERSKRFAGIIIQEYDHKAKKLVGPIRNIFKGTNLGVTEGPHIYKLNGYYYLLTAEGGTGARHAVTLARSKNLFGPYEIHPQNPILSSRNDSNLALQRSGHASLVETQNGQWYMVHLCSRPVKKANSNSFRSVMGRETAIQKVKWDNDGWLRLVNDTNRPDVLVPSPGLKPHPFKQEAARDDFDSKNLNIHFSTLRVVPDETWVSLVQRPGWLRIYGRESLGSKFRQSMVARRITSLDSTAETCVEFEPKTFQQAAGLICFYDTQNYYYLKVTNDEQAGKCVKVCYSINNQYEEMPADIFPIKSKSCFLRAAIDYDKLIFSFSENGKKWKTIDEVFDISTLSDEKCQEGSFTGAFVGMCVQDLAGTKTAADFDYFEYRNN